MKRGIISEKTKRLQGRGAGHGAKYKPWIMAREVGSVGTTAEIIDWKHGRTTQLLSQGEEWWYYYLRWNDEVEDIREQFPLDLEDTIRIAEKLGVKHPKHMGDNMTMTTDLLVDYVGGISIGYSVKTSRKDVDYRLCDNKVDQNTAIRTAEKLTIEKMYWAEKGTQWKLVFKEDLDREYINNIRRVVVYYDIDKVHDNISMIKHKIAQKEIDVDLHHRIDYEALIKTYL